MPESTPPIDVDIAAQLGASLDKVREGIAQRRQRAFESNPEAAAWAALVPFWTRPAAAAAGYPGGVEKSPFLSEAGDGIYRMPEEVRAAYLQGASGRETARSILSTVGSALQKARPTDVPEPLRRWAQLAEPAANPGGSAARYEKEITEMFSAKAADAMPPPDVFNWITAAAPLAEILGRLGDPSLLQAIQRTGRRVELVDRMLRERARLAHYLTRPQQDQVVRELLAPATDAWAAHFIGAGATGKTMLLRHIAWDLAAEGAGAAHARIDFDYLSPDYPRVAPGLLLWAFAQELRVFAENTWPGYYFDKADELFDRVRAASVDGKPAIEHPDFAKGLVEYGTALDYLSNSGARPVLLVLDTCEELVRHEGDGARNVRDTFRILEGLYYGMLPPEQGLPAGTPPARKYLRVVFCGRKLLAKAGANYTAGACDLPARPYLRLHEIRGFTEPEAREYLLDRHPVPLEYGRPIMDSSPDVGSVTPVRWTDPGGLRPAPTFSPFDLNDLAGWVRSDPRPTPDEVRTLDASRYVELRILRRITESDPQRLLPVVSAAGHFDAPFVAAVTGWPADRVESALDILDRQEWTTRRVSPGGTTWSVEPMHRRRMAAYFATRPGWSDDCRAAADYLTEKTLREPVERLDWTDFDAAFRVLVDVPRRAVDWWGRAEPRLVRERGWAWVRDAMNAVLGAWTAAEGERPHPLWPFIAAAYAGALQRLASDKTRLRQAASLWENVAAQAPRFPLPDVAANLHLRGLALAVANTEASEPTSARRFWQAVRKCDPDRLDLATAASLVAGLRTIVGAANRPGTGDGPLVQPELRALFDLPADVRSNPRDDWEACGPRQLLNLLNSLSRRFGDDPSTPDWEAFVQIQAMHCLLQGHAQWILGLGRSAVAIVMDAAGIALQLGDKARVENTGDLFLPSDVKAYILAECMELLYPRCAPAGEVGGFSRRWYPVRASAEADRFMSQMVRMWGACGPRVLAGERGFVGGFPFPNMFGPADPFPRYEVLAWEAMGLLGHDPGSALAALADFRPRVRSAYQPDAAATALFNAYDRLVIRFRLLDERYRPLLGGMPSNPPTSTNLQFQCEQMAGYPLGPVPAVPPTVDADQDYVRVLEGSTPPLAGIAEQIREVDERPNEPLGRLRTHLKAEAFGGEFDPEALEQPAGWLGYVAAAEIAMDAAELLRVRRPEMAARLYRRAAEWYGEGNHAAGQFIATLNLCLADPAADCEPLHQLYDALVIHQSESDGPRRAILPPRKSLLEITTRSDSLSDLLPRVPACWRPLLVRWLVLETRKTKRAEQIDFAVLGSYGRRIGDEIQPPPDLHGWVPSRVYPTARPNELMLRVAADGEMRARWTSGSGEERAANLGPWRGPHADVPDSLKAALDLVADVSSGQELVFDVFSEASGANWEQLVEESAGGRTVRLRRVSNGLRPLRRPPPRSRIVLGIEAGLNSFHVGMTEQGWGAVRLAGGDVRLGVSTERQVDFDTRVLHLVGTPVGDDGEGRRIRFRRRGSDEASYNSNSSSSSSMLPSSLSPSPSFDDADAADSPDLPLTDISLRYPHLTLCVIQPPPGIESQLVTEDADDARLYREFAHELFAAGIPAVLILPPLQLDVATQALTFVSEAVAHPAPDAVQGLTSAVARIRQLRPPDMAGDFTVCLYADRAWAPL